MKDFEEKIMVILMFCFILAGQMNVCAQQKDKVVVGYVTSWSNHMPDGSLITHLNYAFGHVSDSFDSIRIDNTERLKTIVALKKDNPNLKVMLSIGGWGSGRFSEMAADEKKRSSFASHCMQMIKKHNLDGIDIDWEYPTSKEAGISASHADKGNFTLLMRDIRKAIGKNYLLTFADYADTTFVNYREVMTYVDFVNLMTYDIANPPHHHSALFRSDIAGHLTVAEAVDHHLAAGVPLEKLVMGIPFYGRQSKDFKGERAFGKMSVNSSYEERWNDLSLVPYLVAADGHMVLAFENVRSITHKCNYILQKGLRGAMYWSADNDDENYTLSKTVFSVIKQ